MIGQASTLKRNAGKWIPGLLISLIAVVIVFRLANWTELTEAFTHVSILFILMIAFLTFVFLIARGLAWSVILEKKVSIIDSFYTINIGYLLNNLFPFRAGEFGRAVFLGQTTGLGIAHILSSIVIERVFDLIFAAVLLLLTLPLALGMAWARPVAIVTLVVVLFALVIMYLAARYKVKVQYWFEKKSKRLNLVRRLVLPQLEALLDGLAVLTKPGQFLLCFFLIGLTWFIAVIEYFLMGTMVAEHAPFWWGALLDSLLALGIALPSAPAAIGVFEASLVAGMALLNVPGSTALAFAISVHFTQFVVTGIFGFIGLTRGKSSLTSLFSEINKKQAS